MWFRSDSTRSGSDTVISRFAIPLAAALLPATAGDAAAEPAEPGTAAAVDFLVLDDEGRPVPGLAAADIELTEDGREQDFRDFRALGPDAPQGPSGTRRFVIVVNRRGAEARRIRRARSALRRFASEQLAEIDEAMLVGIGPRLEILREFSPGGERLRASLDELSPLPHRVFDGSRSADGGGIWDLLGGLGSALRRVPGRKVVILMSVDRSAGVRQPSSSWAWTFDQHSFLNTLLAFQAARTAVYCVDLATDLPGGSRNRHDPGLGAGRPEDPLSEADWYSARGSHPETDRFEGGLGALAAATGGGSYPSPVNFARVLTEIDVRNRLWYELTWTPDRRGTAGQTRSPDIRIRGRDDLEVVMRPVFFPRLQPAASFEP